MYLDVMGKIKRIFLDIDGVIANWSKKTCEHLEIPYPKDYEFPKQTWLADILHKNDRRLYQFTDTLEFWAELEKFPWSDEIVKLVSRSGKDWRFLTKPMKTPSCFQGKAEWMFRHYPKHWDRMHVGGGTKSYACRNSGDLLIDDAEENILEWKSAGGSVFHWKEITDDYTGDWKKRIEDLTSIINEK